MASRHRRRESHSGRPSRSTGLNPSVSRGIQVLAFAIVGHAVSGVALAGEADHVDNTERAQAASREVAIERANREQSEEIRALATEVARLKEALVLPETDGLKSVYGMGPAASKIYGVKSGISLGGYGEFFFDKKVSGTNGAADQDIADFQRYITYIGYKFTDRILVNAEVEVEHSASSRAGSIALEFAYLDFLAHQRMNFRAGLILMPVGIVNELHEPAYFRGNKRPEVERRIIPATWRELGVGVFGALPGNFNYKIFLTTGLDASGFSPSGWRGGRQKGSVAVAEDLAVVARLNYTIDALLDLGASFFYGGADQGALVEGEQSAGLGGEEISTDTLLTEAHLRLTVEGFEFRALGAYGRLRNARKSSLALFPGRDPADSSSLSAASDDAETRLLASDIFGWYAEISYNLGPWIARLFSASTTFSVLPYVRYEMLDTQAAVPTVPGRSRDRKQALQIWDAGIEFFPHPQVVLKLNYRNTATRTRGSAPDSLLIGAGFVY